MVSGCQGCGIQERPRDPERPPKHSGAGARPVSQDQGSCWHAGLPPLASKRAAVSDSGPQRRARLASPRSGPTTVRTGGGRLSGDRTMGPSRCRSVSVHQVSEVKIIGPAADLRSVTVSDRSGLTASAGPQGPQGPRRGRPSGLIRAERSRREAQAAKRMRGIRSHWLRQGAGPRPRPRTASQLRARPADGGRFCRGAGRVLMDGAETARGRFASPRLVTPTASLGPSRRAGLGFLDDSSSESGSGNGIHTLTPPSAGGGAGGAPAESAGAGPYAEVNGNGAAAPLDFSTTSSSSSSEDQQPINLSERLPAGPLLGPFQPDPPDGLRRKYPGKPAHPADLRLDRDRDYGNKSPQYSSGSYDSVKTEVCPEDLTVSRVQAADDDDDEHDDHDDSDKMNDTERPSLSPCNIMFVRLFVDENLDRMVPISKQPKEKIQAIIESCSRQFPEFQERARKRIRTYLKSCRRMKKNGMETRPTPPHLTSAMAENILAAACESETRKAAKRMRLDVYQSHDEQIALDKPSSREPATLAHSAYSLAASAYSQDQLYINGGLNYSYRGYGGLGPTDLSMKSLASNSSSSSSNSHGRGGGSGGASAQLSPTEITAVRQLIAGYRESAAFLLRSADELESLILQQN
ncbi:hypothetical protein AAFF_G00239950 [Aldrovandia affinis]|uniref:Nucleolar protein 4 helical domain-containing protein n=1 Tax=Aldrovandia affinis TaxID=143900 RepID=A0AAD7WUQ0_9TELE|nr:hypothetical protein AAFF_G00239950 [Aldrovandia affinis]